MMPAASDMLSPQFSIWNSICADALRALLARPALLLPDGTYEGVSDEQGGGGSVEGAAEAAAAQLPVASQVRVCLECSGPVACASNVCQYLPWCFWWPRASGVL